MEFLKLQPIDATNGIMLGLAIGAVLSTYVSIVVNRLADFGRHAWRRWARFPN